MEVCKGGVTYRPGSSHLRQVRQWQISQSEELCRRRDFSCQCGAEGSAVQEEVQVHAEHG